MPNALTLLARGAPPARATADASRPGCGAREAAGTLEMLRARQKGMDPALSDLLDDPAVTDVLINGTHAWVDRGGGLVRVAVIEGTLARARRREGCERSSQGTQVPARARGGAQNWPGCARIQPRATPPTPC